MKIARFQLPDGRVARFQVPDEATPEEAQQLMEEAANGPLVAPNQSEGMKDVASGFGSGLVSGLGSVVKMPGQLYRLASGDQTPTAFDTVGGQLEKYGEGLQTDTLKQRAQQSNQQIEDAYNKNGFLSATGTALKNSITDPALLAKSVGQFAPFILPGGAIGRGAKLTAELAGAGEAGAATAATTAGVATGAAQNAAMFGDEAYSDIYKANIKNGMDEESAAADALSKARATGASAAVISLLVHQLPGAKSWISRVAGVDAGTIDKAPPGALKAALGAMTAGTGEQVAGRIITNAAVSTSDPGRDILQGVPQTVGEMALPTALAGAYAGHKNLKSYEAVQDAKAQLAAAAKAQADAAAKEQEDAAAAAEKEKPEYLDKLDADYLHLIASAKAQRDALGPKPDAKADPSAALAWANAQKEASAALTTPEAKALIAEHAAQRQRIMQRRQEITAQIDAHENADQLAAEQDSTQPTATANAQPDLFAEGQTEPSGGPAEHPAPPAAPVPVEQQIQDLSQQHQGAINAVEALNDINKKAAESGDLDTIIRNGEAVKQATAQRDALAKQLTALTGAADARGKLTKALNAALEKGDAAAAANIAAKLKQLAPSTTPTQPLVSPDNMAKVAAQDAATANEMADAREQQRAVTAKVDAEKIGLENIANKNRETATPSDADLHQEALGKVRLREQKRAAIRAKLGLPPVPSEHEYMQEPLPEGVEANEHAANQLSEALVDPKAVAVDDQIAELKREIAQNRSIGREDIAATLQARVTALEQQNRPRTAPTDDVARVDALHKQLTAAEGEVEHARVTKNAGAAEAASKKASNIADELAQLQQVPGGFAGRLVKAKNDVHHAITAFFDAAHELHTSGHARALRDKQQELRSTLAEVNRAVAQSPGDVTMQAAHRDHLVRQIQALEEQLGKANTETPVKQLRMQARQAMSRYIRAAFREENIRREARGQKPLTGEARKQFARDAQKQAEDLIDRVSAERHGDFIREVEVEPAQMRSGKLIRSARTEWRDIRPLEQRPLAKFGAARAVEEEAFDTRREGLQEPHEKRVEGGVLKRQWAVTEAQRTADESGENVKTAHGQKRRAEYMLNQIDHIIEQDTPHAAGMRHALLPLRDAIENHPYPDVLDAVAPLLHEARTGRTPLASDMRAVHEAVALHEAVKTDHTGQGDLLGPKSAIAEQGRIEDAIAANEAEQEALKGKHAGMEMAKEALRKLRVLEILHTRLETDLEDAKANEKAMNAEAKRTAEHTGHIRTTPVRFDNSPEVKRGREAAAADRAVVEEIRTLMDAAEAEANKPSWFKQLAHKLADLREQVANHLSGRPFAGLTKARPLAISDKRRPLNNKPDIAAQERAKQALAEAQAALDAHAATKMPKYVKPGIRWRNRLSELKYTRDEALKRVQTGKQALPFTEQDIADITFNEATYNMFVDELNKMLDNATEAHRNNPAFQRLQADLELTERALRNLPSNPKLVEARRAAQEAHKKLWDHLASEKPTEPAALQRWRDKLDTLMQARDDADANVTKVQTTPVDRNPEAYAAAQAKAAAERQQRLDNERLYAKERTEARDAAAKERMDNEEAIRRLNKLDWTRVTKNAQSAFGKLLSVQLRKEANSLDAMVTRIESIRANPEYFTDAEAAIAKMRADSKSATSIEQAVNRLKSDRQLDISDENLEQQKKLRAKANANYEMLYSLLPADVEHSSPFGISTSEKDDVVPLAPNVVLQAIDRSKARKAKNEPVDTTRIDEVRKLPSAKATAQATLAADALNERQKARGQAPVQRPINKPGRQRITQAKSNKQTVSVQQAVGTGNKMARDKRIGELETDISHYEDLAEKNQRVLEAATAAKDKAGIKKYTEFEQRLDRKLALLRGELDTLQPARDVGEEAAAPEEVSAADVAGEKPDDVAMERGTSGEGDTALSVGAIGRLNRGDVKGVVSGIAAKSANPIARRVAAIAHSLLGDVKVKLVDDMPGEHPDAPGGISADGKTIFLNRRTGLSEESLLHEVRHAVTMHLLNQPEHLLSKEQVAAKRELEQMHDAVKNLDGMDNEVVRDGDLHEFVAEAGASRNVQALMAGAKWQPKLSLWQGFKRAILNLLGISTPPPGNMLDRMLDLSEKFMRAPGETGGSGVAMLRKKGGGLDMTASADILREKDPSILNVRERPKQAVLAAHQALVDSRSALNEAFRIASDKLGLRAATDSAQASIRRVDAGQQTTNAVLDHGAFTWEKGPTGEMYLKAGKNPNFKTVTDAVDALPFKDGEAKWAALQTFITTRRAQAMKDGWNRLGLTPAEQATVEKDYNAAMADPATRAALEKAQDAYHAFSSPLMSLLGDVGYLPKAVAAKLAADKNYIPWFRQRGDELDLFDDSGKIIAKGDVRTMPFLQVLKGGKSKLMPFEQSLFQNVATLTDMAVRNVAARQTSYILQDLGKTAKVMQIHRGDGPAESDVLRFNDEPDPKIPGDTGKRWLRIETEGTAAEGIPAPLLAQAAAGTVAQLPMTFLGKAARAAGAALRIGVTRNPGYLFTQLFKDPVNAALLGNVNATPIMSVLKSVDNFQKILRGKSASFDTLSRMGALPSQIYGGDANDLAKLALMHTGSKASMYRRVLNEMDRWAHAADSATRVQAFEDILKAGGTELQGAIHAQEMQNFHKRGTSPSVQMAAATIPFFGAQIQGLNTLVRTARGNMPVEQLMHAKEKFRNRMMAMSAMSMMYAAALDDDEEWRNTTMQRKLGYIPLGFKIDGKMVGLPTPFETGVIGWSLPVALYEAMKGNFKTASDRAAFINVMANQLPNNGVPIPQIAKGAIETVTNHDFFTGRPIVSHKYDKLDTSEKVDANTTGMAKLFSKAMVAAGADISPIEAEHLANAYFGQLPHIIAVATDQIFANHVGGAAPTKTAHELPFVGRFVNSSGDERVSEAYDYATQATKIAPTVKEMMLTGDKEKARAYLKEKSAEFGSPAAAQSFVSAMSQLNAQKKIIDRNNNTADEKRAKLDKITERQNLIAQNYLQGVEKFRASHAQ